MWATLFLDMGGDTGKKASSKKQIWTNRKQETNISGMEQNGWPPAPKSKGNEIFTRKNQANWHIGLIKLRWQQNIHSCRCSSLFKLNIFPYVFVHVLFITFSHFLEVMRSSPRETLSQTTSTFASLAPSKFSRQIQRRSVKGGAMVLLMEEFLHHLGCRKPCNDGIKYLSNRCRISSINSSFLFG